MKKIDLYLPVAATFEESLRFDAIVNSLKKSEIALNYVSFLEREPRKEKILGLCVAFDFKEEDEDAINLLLNPATDCQLPTV